MITRRTFVKGSVAASAASLLGCRDQSAGGRTSAAARATLFLSFVGGTVFVKDGNDYLAVQPSGVGVTHHGHNMLHRSFLIGSEAALGTGGQPMPGEEAGNLPATVMLGPAPFRKVCLVGRDLVVEGSNGAAAHFNCQRVAKYGEIAGGWRRIGDWRPGESAAVSTRFTLKNGNLVDGDPVNTEAATAPWVVKTATQSLSDVTRLELTATTITIRESANALLTITAGQTVKLAVFAGPVETHGNKHKYKKVSHAVLLRTLYDVGPLGDEELKPTTTTELEGNEGKPIANPCPGVPSVRVPPDSEFCVNYDELP